MQENRRPINNRGRMPSYIRQLLGDLLFQEGVN
jgi:hypothetical protein